MNQSQRIIENPEFVTKRNEKVKIDKTKLVDKENICNNAQIVVKNTQNLKRKLELIDLDLKNQFKSRNPNNQANNIVNQDEILSEKEKQVKLLQSLYSNRENINLIQQYGFQLFETLKLFDTNLIKCNFLTKHKIDHTIRTKLIDWILEITQVFKIDIDTFFLTVHLIDLYLDKSKNTIESSELHLIAIASIFLAAKFEEVAPLRLKTCVTTIGHNTYSASSILKMEMEILLIIGLENLIFVSSASFIKTYFYDFSFNNSSIITNLNIKPIVEQMESMAIFSAKLLAHYESNYEENQCLNAIICIVNAYDIVKVTAGIKPASNEDSFFMDWIHFLIQNNRLEEKRLKTAYNNLKQLMLNYKNCDLITHRLYLD